MNVVAYCRYSSEAQRDGYSIEAQVRAIEEFCKKEGHNLISTYVDEARSGTSDVREEFQRMIADSSKQLFTAVVVHKLDRFARDRYDSANYKKKLKDNGVRIISVTEPLDGSPESVILESVLEGMAEYYSKNLSRETKKGKREAARQGKYTGGGIPLGLGVGEDNHYYIIEDEATVIRALFDYIDTGHSLYATAKWAAENSFKNKNGNLINIYFIRAMIRNQLYAGNLAYGKKGKSGEGEFLVEGVVDSIIDPDLFYRHFNKAQTRNAGPIQRIKDSDYMLTGYAYCGYCGSHMKGLSRRYRKQNNESILYNYYRCSHSVTTSLPDHVKCASKLIKKNELEDFVVDQIKATFLSNDNLEHIAHLVYERLTKRKAATKDEIKAIEHKVAAIKEKQTRLLTVYLDGTITPEQFKDRNGELTSSLWLLQEELKKTASDHSGITLSLIKRAISAMNITTDDPDSLSHKKRLISTFVKSIQVKNDEVQIEYKINLDPASSFLPNGGAEGVHTTLGINYARPLAMEL